MLAADHSVTDRAAAHILEDCAALSRLTMTCSDPLQRVEALVGHDLAHLLLHGLKSRPTPRPI